MQGRIVQDTQMYPQNLQSRPAMPPQMPRQPQPNMQTPVQQSTMYTTSLERGPAQGVLSQTQLPMGQPPQHFGQQQPMQQPMVQTSQMQAWGQYRGQSPGPVQPLKQTKRIRMRTSNSGRKISKLRGSKSSAVPPTPPQMQTYQQWGGQQSFTLGFNQTWGQESMRPASPMQFVRLVCSSNHNSRLGRSNRLLLTRNRSSIRCIKGQCSPQAYTEAYLKAQALARKRVRRGQALPPGAHHGGHQRVRGQACVCRATTAETAGKGQLLNWVFISKVEVSLITLTLAVLMAEALWDGKKLEYATLGVARLSTADSPNHIVSTRHIRDVARDPGRQHVNLCGGAIPTERRATEEWKAGPSDGKRDSQANLHNGTVQRTTAMLSPSPVPRKSP
ncbi:hypothetical protein WMY93_027562 [Mugilogobius chulae]|uniref:Uncharacterized protein n=1 Tax=Mugilogobius chulae TaxID=88201 RepID=A0AAW0MTA7_9GOBI